MKEKKKMGRPSNNPRREKISIRLSDDEIRKLNECSEKKNVTRTEIIAQGIEKIYREI